MKTAAKFTPEVKRQIALEAKYELARRHYIDYVDLVHHGKWKRAKHLQLVCNKLEKVLSGKCKRLMIFMPPRHGKSMSVTETFPSYFLGKFPDKRVIEVSYGEDLAQRFGTRNRDKVIEFGHKLFGIDLSQVQSKKTSWNIEGHDGGMISVGVGGGITGNGADLLIIDDPIKSREEAESETYRNKLVQEYQSSMLTRLHADAAIIIILTRWHEDDLAAQILKSEGEDWEVLSLPAICDDEEIDLLKRKLGETLWPEQGYDFKWAEKRKKSVGLYAWNSLYQQRPTPLEGGLFKRKWWRFYKVLPSDVKSFTQSWDCTFKDKPSSDFVVGQVWGDRGADFFLIDQIRGRMSFTETIEAIRQMSYKYPKARAKLIEDKANGSAAMDVLKKELSGLIAIEPEGGKFTRANAVSPYAEAGNIWLPDPSIAPWVKDFIDEFSSFPNGAHDDQVDATSQYVIWKEKNKFNLKALIS